MQACKLVLGCEIGNLEFKQAPKLFVGLERRNLKWKQASKLVLEAERWNLTSIGIPFLTRNLRSMQVCEKFLTQGDKFEVRVGALKQFLNVKGGV